MKAVRLSRAGTPYVAPGVFVDVDHGMTLMNDECFGPVVGIMPVPGDEQAIELMNDSPYGLTACVFTAMKKPRYRSAGV